MQPDPLGLGAADLTDPQSLNRYSYVGNDPANFTDPLGLFLLAEGGVGFGGFLDPRLCYAVYLDGIYIGTFGNCGGGGGGGEVGGGGGRGGVSGQAQQQKSPPPCEEQDFNFTQGAGGFTANELSAIAQTAVGEAGTRFAAGEVEAVIATIVNRLNINRLYAAQNMGYFPFRGGTNVIGILGDYQAHWDKSKRRDGLRSGEGKLADEKARNGGVLPANSYVCDQLKAAKNFAKQVGSYDANALFELYPYTWNLGLRAPLPRGAFGVRRIGNTRFFNHPFR
jgi:hypothetical protein